MTRPQGFATTGDALGHHLRDIIYGASDGIVTTMAVVAGVSGAGISPLIAFVLGLANLLADGFSMGAGNYLSLKSELEHQGKPVSEEGPVWHALATIVAFVVFGGLPLAAYVLAGTWALPAFPAAMVVAGLVLAAVGGARAPFTGRGHLGSAMEMLLIGGLATLVAYAVGLGSKGLLA